MIKFVVCLPDGEHPTQLLGFSRACDLKSAADCLRKTSPDSSSRAPKSSKTSYHWRVALGCLTKIDGTIEGVGEVVLVVEKDFLALFSSRSLSRSSQLV
jgi:hypothetical protein